MKVKSHLQIYSEVELPRSPQLQYLIGLRIKWKINSPTSEHALTQPIYSGQSSVLSMGMAESIEH